MRLNELKEIEDLEKLQIEYDQLKAQFDKLLEYASPAERNLRSVAKGNKQIRRQIKENVAFPSFSDEMNVDKLQNVLDTISKQFDAARRGMGLAQKLTGPTKKKHFGRIVGNLNRIRAKLRRVEKLMSVASGIEQEEEEFTEIDDKGIGELLHLIKVQSSYNPEHPKALMSLNNVIGPDWKREQFGGTQRIKQLLAKLHQLGKIKYSPNTETISLIDQDYFDRQKSYASSVQDFEKQHGPGTFTKGT